MAESLSVNDSKSSQSKNSLSLVTHLFSVKKYNFILNCLIFLLNVQNHIPNLKKQRNFQRTNGKYTKQSILNEHKLCQEQQSNLHHHTCTKHNNNSQGNSLYNKLSAVAASLHSNDKKITKPLSGVTIVQEHIQARLLPKCENKDQRKTKSNA